MDEINVCSNCKNYRFTIVNGNPEKCERCNNDEKYKLKEITVCLGCGRDYDRSDCDCPAGTANRLVKQDS